MLSQGKPAVAADRRAALPLRGRDQELRAVASAVEALRHGRGSVVLIEGAPGAGKSSLLAEAGAVAERAGLGVHRGSGDPAAETMPLAPLLDALLGGPEPILDVEALRTSAAHPDSNFWVMLELQDRLERAALESPLVIAIDDVQWADAATLLALRTLPARLSTHAVLWLLALRPGGAPITADRLRATGARTLQLRPLDPGAVAELAEDVLGAAPDSAVLDLAHGVEGRPFLLVELLRGLRDEGQIAVQGGRAQLVGRRLPGRLRDTVAARVERLSEPARDLVRMASVLGRRFSMDHLAALLGQGAPGLLAPLQEALESELLVEDGDALAFRHDLIREAVDAGLPRSLRQALRREAVAVMLERRAPAAEVAVLLLEVAEPGDATAVAALRQAATELAQTMPSMAARLSSRALDLLAADDPARPDVVAETIALLYRAGSPAAARGLADTALRRELAPAAEATVRLGLAQASVQHAFTEVVHQARAGLALPGLPEDLRLHLRVTLTLGFLMNGDFAEARAAMLGDLDAARAAGDLAAEVAALNSCSAVSFHLHRHQEALDYADAAQARAAAGGPDAQRLWPDVWGAWLRGAIGRTDEALPRTLEGLRAAQRDGRASDVRFWLTCRSAVLLAAGRLADARAEAEAVIDMVDDLGVGASGMAQASYVLGRVALHTGDRRGVRAAAAAAAAMRAEDSLNLRRNGEWLAALIADADGEPAHAMALLADTFEELGELGPGLHTPQDADELLTLLRMTLRAAELHRAEAVTREMQRRAALNPGFALQATLARHARGLLDGDAEAMRASVGALGVVSGPLAKAEILEDASRVLAPVEPSVAIEYLDAALQHYSDAGADRDAARSRRGLRELGARRRQRPAARRSSRWGGLTDSELAVVRLVAEGATNRQAAERLYLSPHTVSSHLRHAFEKLDIRSRVELAVLYAESGGAAG